MSEQLKRKHDELLENLRKHDEALLKLLKQGHRDLIVQVIKAYLLLDE